MNCAERFTRANRIANLLVQDQAYGGIDEIFFFLAAATEHQAGDADLLALNAGNVSTRRAEEWRLVPRPGQTLNIVYHARVATLLRNDLAELPER